MSAVAACVFPPNPHRCHRAPGMATLSCQTVCTKPMPCSRQPLHATDGVTFAIQKMADAAQQIDVVRPIIASPAARFIGQIWEKSAFPKP